MAEPGKKGKKKKGKVVSLNEFLAKDSPRPSQASTGSHGHGTFVNRSTSWADEAEGSMSLDVDTRWPEESFGGSSGPGRRPIDRSALPTAPRSSRAPEIDFSKLPSNPPFTAFLGNLPYDVDKEDILKFFQSTKITEVRLPVDSGGGRAKGFGYAEFADKQSLIQALELNNESLGGRKVRVDVAGNQQGDRDRGDRREIPDIPDGDWRSNKPADIRPDRYNEQNGFSRDDSRDGFRGRDDRYGGPGGRDGGFGGRDGSYGGRDDRFGGRDDRFGGRDDRFGSRDDRFGGRDDRYGGRDDRFGGRDDRFGGRDDRYGGRDDRFGGRDDRFGGRGDRYGGRDDRFGSRGDRGDGFGSGWGGGSRDGYRGRDSDDRGPDGRYGDRAGYQDKGDYSRQGGDDRDEREPPKERRKLNLQPRSKPKEEETEKGAEGRSSVFGAAKPVDTRQKEKEIEEKLAKTRLEEQRHKEEQERQKEEWKRNEQEPRGRRDSGGFRDSGGRSRRDSDKSADSGGRPWKDSDKLADSGGRPRKDSDKSVDSGGRSRKDSDKSVDSGGRRDSGGRPRRDSDKSVEDKGAPTTKPATKPAPQAAPAPTVNVWAKRMEAQKAGNPLEQPGTNTSNTAERSEPPLSPPAAQTTKSPQRGEPDTGRGRGTRGRGRGRGRGDYSNRGDRQPASQSGAPQVGNSEEKKEKRDRKPPELPKYQEDTPPVFHKQSKFSLLMGDENDKENEEAAEEDSEEQVNADS